MRLIDADALEERVKRCYCEPCEAEKRDYNHVRCRACEAGDTLDWIEDAPTIDAVPVRRGKWLKYHHSYFGRHQCVCSECADSDYWKKYFCYGNENFCPNCGADMREE